MKFLSTSGAPEKVSFREAVMRGLAPDNGLYYPESIPQLSKDWIERLPEHSLTDIGYEVMRHFTNEDLDEEKLREIIGETLNFPIPLVPLSDNLYTLELFHGPTLAFKDVGARFLARCLGTFAETGKQITVLVATSGDTGSAVGRGFFNVPGVDVKILYPSGKVSKLQEQQLTTLGNNIEAYEINGSFDDCQRMVKEAFLDKELQQELTLTSANSINIARWLPQSIYYFWAIGQLPSRENVVISVPSGNYGNLAGGLLAKAMGLPVAKFIASSNSNDIFPAFLRSGSFDPRPSVKTISNAMDVGNPSNHPRIIEIYQALFDEITKDIAGYSCSDEQTKLTIKSVLEKYHYLTDPHGAVGYYGLEKYCEKHEAGQSIFLETAHPAKFHETIQEITGMDINIPERLRVALDLEKRSTQLKPTLVALKEKLMP